MMRPARRFCLAFAAALAGGLLLAAAARERGAAPALDAQGAKSRQRFWASTGTDEAGVPVDLIGRPELLARLYPGYDIARDGALWDLYFRADFSPDPFVPELGAGVKVGTPWTGCFLLARRHGADVVVFGNSETYRAVVPGLLSDRLTAEGTAAKVLMCATNGLPLATVPEAVAEMRPMRGGKAKLAILGYSFWQAYARSADQKAFLAGKRYELVNHRIRTGAVFASIGGVQSRSLAVAFPPLSWDSVFPSARAADPGARSPGAGVEVPAAWAADASRLAGAELAGRAPFAMLDGATSADCGDPAAEAELDAALAALQLVAERVLVYLTPTTELHRRGAPACLEESARRLLRRRAGPRVTVMTGGWEDYGLDHRHFLWPAGRADRLRIDLNHVNQTGAELVTARLAGAAGPLLGAAR